jgi:ABC-type transport system involved in multi-copper enzyme maturation permease subunit
LLDTYRELSTKKLFWATIILSGLLVLSMAAVGINEQGLTILHWQLGSFNGVLTSKLVPPALLYKQIFINLGIGVWLSWGAVILALVSTSGLVPDMIASGAIETTLSKPISRTRLLLSKFAGGLLFGALQVCVFCSAAFLVIGIRGGSWEPMIFLAVPLVVLVNSYLLCIAFLAGLITRSTITALIITMLFWFVVFLANTTDTVLLSQTETARMRVDTMEKRIARDQERLTTVRPEQVETLKRSIEERTNRRDEAKSDLAKLEKWSRLPVVIKTVLPKTGETIELLSRTLRKELRTNSDGEDVDLDTETELKGGGMMSMEERRELTRRIEDRLDGRSVWWVLGTSVAFVAVVLTITCVLFRRRDF